MTTSPEDDWRKDEEYVSYLMKQFNHTREQVLESTMAGWSMWRDWSAGRAVGEAGMELLRTAALEHVKATAAVHGEVERLQSKLEEVRDSWYFMPECLKNPDIAIVMCMCGVKIQFTEPGSSRKANCNCGRRWLWRWTDKGPTP